MSRAWPTVIAKIPDSVRHSADQDQVLAGFWRIWVTPFKIPQPRPGSPVHNLPGQNN